MAIATTHLIIILANMVIFQYSHFGNIRKTKMQFLNQAVPVKWRQSFLHVFLVFIIVLLQITRQLASYIITLSSTFVWLFVSCFCSTKIIISNFLVGFLFLQGTLQDFDMNTNHQN